MAAERVLAKLPKVQAPKFCYICLEGDGVSASSKLMRGCACRGDSAGFVHIKCLTELAKSKETTGDAEAILEGWTSGGNCKQIFQSALQLEMIRRFWRRYRITQDDDRRYNSTRCLAISLGAHYEFDAANQLFDEASTWVGNATAQRLDLKLSRSSLLSQSSQHLEALELLQATLPEV